jgi:hypothetical protein
MIIKPTNDEKLLCAAWFIALFFVVLQIVSMIDCNQDMRRARRVKVKSQNCRTIRIARARRKAA